MKPVVYLAGPMNGRSDYEVFDWRREAARELAGFVILDPARRDFRGVESSNVAEIVEGDKRDIDNADIVLAYAVTPSVGTSMEILYAFSNQLKKFVVVVVGAPGASPWLLYHSDVAVGSLSEALQAVKEYAKATWGF